MTTPLAPSPAVFPKVQLTARQRACLEQIARRQTSPQRLVRRAKILLTLEMGGNQCQVMRQLHLNRGTVQTWRQRWLALAPKLVQMEIDGGSDKGNRSGSENLTLAIQSPHSLPCHHGNTACIPSRGVGTDPIRSASPYSGTGSACG